MSACAMLLALALVELLLPAVRPLVGVDFDRQSLDMLQTALTLTGATLLLALLAGAWPAVVLSGLKPSHILQGTLTRDKAGQALRSMLVTAQFAAAITL